MHSMRGHAPQGRGVEKAFCAGHERHRGFDASIILGGARPDKRHAWRTFMPLDLPTLLFWLKKTAAVFALPPLMPLLPIIAGLLLIGARPRIGKALAWGGLALNLALITPASVSWLVEQVEYRPPLDETAAARAQAIVVLGAGRRRHAPEFGGETINRLALERLRYAALLARKTGLPLLLSGGAPVGEAPEAVLMQRSLAEDFGVQARWLETASRDTRENARLSAIQLEAAGVRTILLVTHAMHMDRARTEFAAAGLEVIPAPTAWLGSGDGSAADEQGVQLPSQNTAYAAWFALHELLGQTAYRLSR